MHLLTLSSTIYSNGKTVVYLFFFIIVFKTRNDLN